MTAARYELVVAPSARRQLSETLPEAVAVAGFEFIVGPLLDNPRRAGKRLRPPLDDRHSARLGTYPSCTGSMKNFTASPCSACSHELRAVVDNGVAMWRCTRGDHLVAAVGDLQFPR